MIEVTLGEVKHHEIPFPKLMVNDLGQIWLMVGINKEHFYLLVGVRLFSNGYSGGNVFSEKMDITAFRDYDGPITIQNFK